MVPLLCSRALLSSVELGRKDTVLGAGRCTHFMEDEAARAEDSSKRFDGTESRELSRHRAPRTDSFHRFRDEQPATARFSKER